MGGKMSKFGIFSPAVYAAKAVLGEAKLNKLRGKAISLHSQAITEWCQQYGAYNLRLKLVRSSFAQSVCAFLSHAPFRPPNPLLEDQEGEEERRRAGFPRVKKQCGTLHNVFVFVIRLLDPPPKQSRP